MEEALKLAKNDPTPYIIGGGEIYEIGMSYAQCIELTRVHNSFDADTFFRKLTKNCGN